MHGSIKGLWFTFKRIIKCQPFCDGGYDTVPISIKNSKPLNKKI
ncbi:hemolytic domain protein [Rickettsia parkeri str. Tate's Hell]|nr:hypothetical protein Rsl_564 [Rickettsia slovaca 13-B]KJW01415.1 hemolytic domain protein [Rickettsia parkeri str. Tate's Hell]